MCLMSQYKDILVKSRNPELLDRAVQNFNSAVIGGGTPEGYHMIDDAYIVRCFGNPEFLKFAITNQGYGQVIKELEPDRE